MSSALKCLIILCMFSGLARNSPIHAAPSGFLEGHLKIIALRGAELADETPSKGEAGDYAGYPLIILSSGQKKEIARVTADENGKYRIALPPGDYVLDVQGRGGRDVRATPQPFTVTSNQTVRVDMNVDTGIR